MMKNKMILTGAAVALILALILGMVTGYRFPAAEAEEGQKDSLIGVYLTTEYVEEIEDNLIFSDPEDLTGAALGLPGTDGTERRLYATRTDGGTTAENAAYEFKVPGYAFFTARIKEEGGTVSTMIVDEAVCEISQHIKNIDGEESMELEGSVYIAPDSGIELLYLNPVYETPEGEIYMVPGTGCMIHGSIQNGSITQEIREDYQETTGSDVSREKSFSCKVKFELKEPADEVRLSCFDKDHQLIKEEPVNPGSLPESLTITKDTAYFIVEEISSDNTVRTLYDRDTAEYVRFFREREDGMMTARDTAIEWE